MLRGATTSGKKKRQTARTFARKYGGAGRGASRNAPTLGYNVGPNRLPAGSFVRFTELLERWQQDASDARTATEYSVRLPLDAAARLHALADLFPGRTREQLITDLLGAALHELAAAIPYVQGKKVISNDEHGDPLYEDVGLTPRLIELTRKHRKKLEAELEKR